MAPAVEAKAVHAVVVASAMEVVRASAAMVEVVAVATAAVEHEAGPLQGLTGLLALMGDGKPAISVLDGLLACKRATIILGKWRILGA